MIADTGCRWLPLRQPAQGRFTRGQWMQNIDRPANIEALSQPPWARRSRVETKTLRRVLRSQAGNWVGGYFRWGGDFGENLAVRLPEMERAVWLSIDPIALLMHRAVMTATEQGEIRERRRPPLGPVPHVMPLAQAQSAAGKAAATVTMVKRAAEGWRDRSCSSAYLHDLAVWTVTHHHATGITRQALRRFRRNVRAPVED